MHRQKKLKVRRWRRQLPEIKYNKRSRRKKNGGGFAK